MIGNDRGNGAGFGSVQRRHQGTPVLQGRVSRRTRERVAAGGGPSDIKNFYEFVPLDSTVVPVLSESVTNDDGPVAPPSAFWAGRLELDMDLCPTSPVVKGTGVTVRRVVSMVVDGRSWAEILRVHPELTVADIRACLAYCVEEENAGSFDSVGNDDDV